MNSIALVLLALGTDASATRAVESPRTIAATVLRLAVGTVAREIGGGIGDGLVAVRDRDLRGLRGRFAGLPDPELDGRRVPGLRGWLLASGRIVAYVLDARGVGSVRWAGGLGIGGYHVAWSLTISDDRLMITADIGGVAELDMVRLVIVAAEQGRRTSITGTATGWTHWGDRCNLVRKVARRKIREGLDRQLLAVIETAGREMYQSGDPRAAIVVWTRSLATARSR